MKKTIINFQNPLYTVCFFVLFLLTACQKEIIQPTLNEGTIERTTINKTTEAHELNLSDLAAQMNSNARADSWMVMNELVHVTYEGPYLISINVEDMPDPSTHRLDVTIIPFDKPTDLVLQSFDPERNPTHLDIKESRNLGMNTDFIKFRQNDFVAGETNAVIKIEWEGFGNKFEVKINAVPVDCEEDQPRRLGDVGIDYQPVCGCDGRTYFDQTAAYNAGISSYERGQCSPNLNIPIEGIWEAINPDLPAQIIEFFEDCFFITIIDILEDGTNNSQTFIACPEDEETTKEGRTFTIVDKKKEGLPLIWSVEKWSLQVNRQGELEILRTDDTKKDKKDQITILSRYKRIK